MSGGTARGRRVDVRAAVAVAVLALVLGGPARDARGQSAPPVPIDLHLDYTLDRTADPESFTRLGGLAVAPDGRLYAVDVVDHRVLRFGPGPTHPFERTWGGWGQAEGQFDFSQYDTDVVRAVLGIAVGADGTVWVADTGNHRIQRFGADGTFRGAWGHLGSAPGEWKWPVAIAVAADGTLYVSDAGNRRVQHVTADGRPLHAWGVGDASAPEGGRPVGLVVDADGTVLVADAGTPPRLRRYGPTGDPRAAWPIVAPRVSNREQEAEVAPLGIATAPDGTYFAGVSRYSGPLVHLGADGRVLGWPGGPAESWIGWWNGGVAVGPDGEAFSGAVGAIARFGPDGEGRGVIAARPMGYGQVGPFTALAVDVAGQVYSVDPASRRVQVFRPDGAMIREWRGSSVGTSGDAAAGVEVASGEGPFGAPRDVAIAPDGTIYVLDTGTHRVRWQSADGRREGGWGGRGSAPGAFDEPLGLAVAPDGTVYVADTGNDRVQAFTADGTYVGSIGGPDPGGESPPPLGALDRPVDVAVAPDGTIRVVEAGNHRVHVFGRDGTPHYALGAFGSTDGQLKDPAAIAVDPSGGTWVADRGNDRLVRWDACGRVMEGWGGARPGYGAYRLGELDDPTGIAIGADGTAYAADNGNGRIQAIAPGGDVVRVWGVTQVDSRAGTTNVPFAAEGDITGTSNVAATPNGGFVTLDEYPSSTWSAFDADGRWLGRHPLEARADGGHMARPERIAVAPDGTVLVGGQLDDTTGGIARFGADGRHLGGWTIDDLSGVNTMAAAGDGGVFVGVRIDADPRGDSGETQGEVRRYGADGTLLATWPSGGSVGPWKLVAGRGSLFTILPTATFGMPAQIVRLSESLVEERRWGAIGRGPGEFGDPCCGVSDLAAWPDGTVVAGDWGNQRVQLFDPDGRFLGQWGIVVNHDVPPWPFPGPLVALTDGTLVVRGTNGRLQRFTRSDVGTWHVAYYPNRWTAQRPLVVQRTASATFDWGGGAPDAVLPRDGFSAVVQRVVELPAGRHRFRIRARGGVRAWADDRLVADDWDGPTVDAAFDVVSDGGDGGPRPHAIRVAYDDPGGEAWLRIDGPDPEP